PAGPSTPSLTYPVPVVVFYDENGNGLLDPGEGARVPGVEANIGGHTARSDKVSGLAVVPGVSAGAGTVAVRPDTLPPFYRPPAAAVSVSVPPSSNTNVPLTLPIGSNTPSLYMAFGDSITVGDGSSDGAGYRDQLQGLLQGYFGRGALNNQGITGTRSNFGAERIADLLRHIRPAYTLILYGTNDWNTPACKQSAPCFTVDSLRSTIQDVKASGSLPVLATIPPANPSWPTFVAERNVWVSDEDVLIRALAREQGAALADIEGAFRSAAGSDLSQLFSDHIHPNDRGYAIIAATFFASITQPGAAATAAANPAPPLFREPVRGLSPAPHAHPPHSR
ncbi:MAG TPA: SGNH/GDSL hydrolase family protein, partial [Vicinamibacteria bacterium]|nr:SGNH/GDSL hydrolase family protein [Vicinamibacteria bacterium]